MISGGFILICYRVGFNNNKTQMRALTAIVLLLAAASVMSQAATSGEMPCTDPDCGPCKRVGYTLDIPGNKATLECLDCGGSARLGKKDVALSDMQNNSKPPALCTSIPIWAIVVIVVGGVIIIGLAIWLIIRAIKKNNGGNQTTVVAAKN